MLSALWATWPLAKLFTSPWPESSHRPHVGRFLPNFSAEQAAAGCRPWGAVGRLLGGGTEDCENRVWTSLCGPGRCLQTQVHSKGPLDPRGDPATQTLPAGVSSRGMASLGCWTPGWRGAGVGTFALLGLVRNGNKEGGGRRSRQEVESSQCGDGSGSHDGAKCPRNTGTEGKGGPGRGVGSEESRRRVRTQAGLCRGEHGWCLRNKFKRHPRVQCGQNRTSLPCLSLTGGGFERRGFVIWNGAFPRAY